MAKDTRLSHKYSIRLTINRTREGRAIKMSKARKVKGSPIEKYKSSGIILDGITTEDELRRAIKVQFDHIFEEIVEHFKTQLNGAEEDVQKLREKQRVYIERARAKKAKLHQTVDGGGNKE